MVFGARFRSRAGFSHSVLIDVSKKTAPLIEASFMAHVQPRVMRPRLAGRIQVGLVAQGAVNFTAGRFNRPLRWIDRIRQIPAGVVEAMAGPFSRAFLMAGR